MKTLDRYIAISIVKGYLLVVLVLVSLFSFLALVEELGDVGEGQYQLMDALFYVGLTLPRYILDLLSFTALLGSIIALGALAGAGELLAMQAAGISVLQIGWSTLKTGALLMLFAAMMAEFVVPPLEQMALTQRSLALSEGVALQTGQGFWTRDGRRFVNVRNVLHRRIPADIDIYEFDPQGRLRTFTHAGKADVLKHGQWVLMDVHQKVIVEQNVTNRYFEHLLWDSFLTAQQIGIFILPPESLSPSDLYFYVQNLKMRGQNVDRYELALWQKLSIPLTSGIMVLVSLPFIFGPLRMATTGYRIILGSIVGIGFYLLREITGYLGLFLALDPMVIVMIPMILMMGIAVWLLRRTN